MDFERLRGAVVPPYTVLGIKAIHDLRAAADRAEVAKAEAQEAARPIEKFVNDVFGDYLFEFTAEGAKGETKSDLIMLGKNHEDHSVYARVDIDPPRFRFFVGLEVSDVETQHPTGLGEIGKTVSGKTVAGTEYEYLEEEIEGITDEFDKTFEDISEVNVRLARSIAFADDLSKTVELIVRAMEDEALNPGASKKYAKTIEAHRNRQPAQPVA